jgi:hypothetical protein
MNAKEELDNVEWRILDLELARLKKSLPVVKRAVPVKTPPPGCRHDCIPYRAAGFPAGFMKARSKGPRYLVGEIHRPCGSCGKR